MELQNVTSATVTPRLQAASRSTWSLPMPAVRQSFSFGAFSMRSAVMYAGQKGWEITTSASARWCSSSESGPSLSAVTTNSTPRCCRKPRSPSSPLTQPSSAPGAKSGGDAGVGARCPSG